MEDTALQSLVVAGIGNGVWIVIAVFVLTGIGVVYGMYTRKGSGINEHPGPESSDPGPEWGEGETEMTGPDGKRLGRPESDDSKLDQHGTR